MSEHPWDEPSGRYRVMEYNNAMPYPLTERTFTITDQETGRVGSGATKQEAWDNLTK